MKPEDVDIVYLLTKRADMELQDPYPSLALESLCRKAANEIRSLRLIIQSRSPWA